MPKKYINKTTCQLPLSPLIKKKLSSSLQWDKNYQVYHFLETGGGGGSWNFSRFYKSDDSELSRKNFRNSISKPKYIH